MGAFPCECWGFSKHPRKLVIERIKPTSGSVAESHRRNLKKFQKLKGDGKNANL